MAAPVRLAERSAAEGGAMCLSVYVASDGPLPTVPCDPDQPGIHVEDATEGYFYPDNPLRTHSGRRFFYSVCPQGSCGCGFRSYASDWDDEAGEYVEHPTPAQLAAWRALADYLTAALRHQASVEVFTFCSGDESCPPRCRREARPADFLTDRSLFDMWQVVFVSETNAEPGAAPGPARIRASGDV
jgi:hypothetical protein